MAEWKVDESKKAIQTRGPLEDQDWREVCEAARERGVTRMTCSGPISDNAMQELGRLTQLKEISFDGAIISDAGLLALGNIHGLEALDLSGPKSTISDAGLGVIKELKKLKRLKMCWPSRVTDEGAAHLAECTELEEVDLMGTHTGDGVLRALAGKAKLRGLKTGRKVTDAGVKWLHEIPMFKRAHGPVEDGVGLMSFMPEKAPNLLLDGPVTDAGLARLAGLDGLYGLGFFWHAKAFTAGGLSAVAAMGGLGFLAIDGSKADDEAMAVIAQSASLRMLQAQGAIASDAGFEALARSKSLEYLWGRECPNLTGRGFAALAGMKALRGLGVSCAKVDDESLGKIAQARKLTQLMPMDVTDGGFAHVGRCTGLEDLWCMYCRETGDAATEQLGGLKLRSYYAGKTLITDKSLMILAKMQTLEKIELWQTMGVTDVGVKALAALPGLKKLSMSGLTGVSKDVEKAFGAGVEVEW